MLTLGLIHSPWALFGIPAVMLSAGALSAGAMILTGSTRQISSLEKVMTLVVFPLFLFSGTFFPVDVYPGFLQPIVKATPLYHSATLLRSLTTGQVSAATLGHVAYLIGMFVIAGYVAVRLMRRRLVS
jgi:lipooligosaccharide transport system permease protein